MGQTTTYEDIIYEVRERAAWIIINRPKVYNAFRGQTVEELISAFQRAANDREVSCVVLTGAGGQGLLHTGGDQSAHEGAYDGRGVVRPADRRIAGHHPRHPQAGDRPGQRLRHRRRQCAGHPCAT